MARALLISLTLALASGRFHGEKLKANHQSIPVSDAKRLLAKQGVDNSAKSTKAFKEARSTALLNKKAVQFSDKKTKRPEDAIVIKKSDPKRRVDTKDREAVRRLEGWDQYTGQGWCLSNLDYEISRDQEGISNQFECWFACEEHMEADPSYGDLVAIDWYPTSNACYCQDDCLCRAEENDDTYMLVKEETELASVCKPSDMAFSFEFSYDFDFSFGFPDDFSHMYTYDCASDCNGDCALLNAGECAASCEYDELKALKHFKCPYAENIGFPTPAPTTKPTNKPTLYPTPSGKFVSYVKLEVTMTSEKIPSSDEVDKLKDVFIAQLDVDASKIEDFKLEVYNEANELVETITARRRLLAETYTWKVSFKVMEATADDIEVFETIIEDDAFATAVAADVGITVTVVEVNGSVGYESVDDDDDDDEGFLGLNKAGGFTLKLVCGGIAFLIIAAVLFVCVCKKDSGSGGDGSNSDNTPALVEEGNSRKRSTSANQPQGATITEI